MEEKILRYADLPDVVMDFLSDPKRMDFVVRFSGRFGLADGSDQKLLVIADDLVLGKIRLSDLPDALVRDVGIGKERAIEGAVEFAASRVLPIADLVGIDAIGALKTWGADPASYKDVKAIEAAPAPLPPPEETATGKALADVGAVFPDRVMQHRLELIVASYRDGVRTREQAVSVLMRSLKTGGLEMSEKAAGEVLELVGEKPIEATFENSKRPALPAGRQETKTIEVKKEGAKADSFSREDEEEIRKVVEEKKVTMEVSSLVTDTKAAAEKIAADAKLVFATGELKTRYEHIIDARLRDVRDGFETREKLEAPIDQGGVGLSGAQLVAVMEAVEAMDAMHHRALAVQMEEKKQRAKVERFERAETVEKTQAREEQVMAKRYAEITGKAPTELVSPAPSRSSVAMPAADALLRREQRIDTEKVKAAIDAAKAAEPVVRPVLSEASFPVTPSGRPKVEDIRFERTLAGPIEELRLLTLTDFRRHSKDPKQATQKIQDKVDLVSQEGYDRRIAAIRAWRESPLCKLYVALSREALIAGKGIAQILAAKRSGGEDVLTDDELKAIVELNGILRF